MMGYFNLPSKANQYFSTKSSQNYKIALVGRSGPLPKTEQTMSGKNGGTPPTAKKAIPGKSNLGINFARRYNAESHSRENINRLIEVPETLLEFLC